MEPINKKLISEKTFKLSQIKDLKVVDLDCYNSLNNDEQHDFLEENLKEYLLFLLTEKNKDVKIKKPFSYEEFKSLNLKFTYDLSYSQSSHFYFNDCYLNLKDVLRLLNFKEDEYKRLLNNEDVSFKIEDNNIVNYSDYIGFDNTTDDITEELQTIEEKLLSDLEEYLKSFLEDLSKVLKDNGYTIIENTEEENTLRDGFNKFIEENNLSFDCELYDLNYLTESKKGFIKICDWGNTNLKGLWIEDFKIKETEYKTTYKEIEKEVLIK